MEVAAFGLAAAFVVSLLISLLLTALLLRQAPRLGLIDQPGERKVHVQPTPRGGGLAIFAAMLAAPVFAPASVVPLLAFGAVIVALGLVDDWRPLSWQVRLGVQAAVAALTIHQFGGFEKHPVVWSLALIWIVGLTNAFNMLDNMDALSAGTAWIASGMLAAAVLLRQGPPRDPLLMTPHVVMMGALAGFLWFNRPPARIFMGDAGSTFLGFFLASQVLQDGMLSSGNERDLGAALGILAVPWYDLAAVVTLRLSQGRSPFHADKQHLSHRLVEQGLSGPAAVRVIHLLALASGLGGVLCYLVPADGVIPTSLGMAGLWIGVGIVDLVLRRRLKQRGP